jgi:hypothetical protein
MFLELGLVGLSEFHTNEFETSCLKTRNDFSDQSSLDTVGFYHDKSSFFLGIIILKVFINLIDFINIKIIFELLLRVVVFYSWYSIGYLVPY